MGMLDIFGKDKRRGEAENLSESLKEYQRMAKKAFDSIVELYKVRKRALLKIYEVEKSAQQSQDTSAEQLDMLALLKLETQQFNEYMEQEEILSSRHEDSRNQVAAGSFKGTAMGDAINKLGAHKGIAFVTTFGTVATTSALGGSLVRGTIGIGSTGLGLGIASGLTGAMFGPVGLMVSVGAAAVGASVAKKKKKQQKFELEKQMTKIQESINNWKISISDIESTINKLKEEMKKLDEETKDSNWNKVISTTFNVVKNINKQFTL